jgi:hypothetical protein
MNRADRLRLHALHQAAANALAASLKDEAVEVYEKEGSADRWKLAAGEVYVSTTTTGAHIEDREVFLDYLEEHTAAVQRIEVRTVPDSFMESFLTKGVEPVVLDAGQTPEGPEAARTPTAKELGVRGATFSVQDANGRLVPGVRYVVGGGFFSAGIKLDAGLKRELAMRAYDYAAGRVDLTDYLEGV